MLIEPELALSCVTSFTPGEIRTMRASFSRTSDGWRAQVIVVCRRGRGGSKEPCVPPAPGHEVFYGARSLSL